MENSSSCILSLYDTPSYQWVAGARIATGLLSFICCLLLVIFFVYSKLKQQIVTNQILVFFLTISALLHSFSYLVSRVNYHSTRPITDNYCLFAGALELYTGWTEWMCIFCISCNLLAQVTCQPKTKQLHWVYFSLIFALPILWCWVPFISHVYGTAGPWCGIRIFTEDCETYLYGILLRFFLLKLPIISLFIATVVFSLATWIFLKHRLRTCEAASYPQSTSIDKPQLLAELKVLLWYPPVYTVLQLLLLVNLVYDSIWPTSPILVLWYLQVLTSPLAGAVIALVIVLNSETNPRARMRSWITHLFWRPREQSDRDRCSSDRQVRDYMCDLNISYGDSLEGMRNKHRRERIRNSDVTQLPPVTE